MAEELYQCKKLMECIIDCKNRFKDASHNGVIYVLDLTIRYFPLIDTLVKNHKLDTCDCRPIHRLLGAVGLRFFYPIHLLELLATKFDVNAFDITIQQWTSLQLAVKNRQYDAIRWLVDHGANPDLANGHSQFVPTTPIVLLATMGNIPLDLFDLLRSNQNLNSCEVYSLPLHVAIRHGHIDSAMHLIRIGARVDQMDFKGNFPVDYLNALDSHAVLQHSFYEELFPLLIIAETSRLLKTFNNVVGPSSKSYAGADKMFVRLSQRMIPQSKPNLIIRFNERGRWCDWSPELVLDGKVLVSGYRSFKQTYMMRLLLVLMDWDIVSNPLINLSLPNDFIPECDLSQLEAIQTIWRLNAEKSRVHPLFKLCIIQIKRSMNSLSEESFQSLPLPPSIRNRLMYRDVAKVKHIVPGHNVIPWYILVSDIINNFDNLKQSG